MIIDIVWLAIGLAILAAIIQRRTGYRLPRVLLVMVKGLAVALLGITLGIIAGGLLGSITGHKRSPLGPWSQ